MRAARRLALLVAGLALAACAPDPAGRDDATPIAPSRTAPTVDPASSAGALPPPTVTRSLRRQSTGWEFDVDAAITDDRTRVDVLVRPATVGAAPRRVVGVFDGTLMDAFATDLDADAAPELLLWTTGGGSLAEGEMQGWRFEAGGEAIALRVPALDADTAVGWRGRDQWGIQGDALVRSFPLYRDEDDNARPTAGFVRVVRYHLDGDALAVADTTLEPMDGTPQADVLAR